MTGRSFVAEVTSRISAKIPKKFAGHHDIQPGDTVELRIVSHKRDGETLYEEHTNES